MNRRTRVLAFGVLAVAGATAVAFAHVNGSDSGAASRPQARAETALRRAELVMITLPARTTCPRPLNSAIGRAVGLPGENVAVRSGRLYVNGRQTHVQPYLELADREARHRDFRSQHVPRGQYLVLGDPDDAACDSRYLGPIPRSLLVRARVPTLVHGSPFRKGYATCASFGRTELSALFGDDAPRVIAARVAAAERGAAKRRISAGCLAGLEKHRLGRMQQKHEPVTDED